MTYGRSLFDQPIYNNKKKHLKILEKLLLVKKIITLLVLYYDLSKHQALDPDSKVVQQINFVGNLQSCSYCFETF